MPKKQNKNIMILSIILDTILKNLKAEPEPTEQYGNENIDIPPLIDGTEQFENTVTTDFAAESKYYLKWSKNYKEACKIIYDKQSKLEDFQKAEQLLLSESKSGNVLAIHDLSKLYSTDKLGAKDEEKSFAYYQEALQGFLELESKDQADDNLFYKIGMMYKNGLGTDMDISKAIDNL